MSWNEPRAYPNFSRRGTRSRAAVAPSGAGEGGSCMGLGERGGRLGVRQGGNGAPPVNAQCLAGGTPLGRRRGGISRIHGAGKAGSLLVVIFAAAGGSGGAHPDL